MEKLITMTTKEIRKYDIIKNLINKKINGTQAAKQLNLSIRQTKRLKAKVKIKGIWGIIHGNRGKKSNREIDPNLKNEIIGIIKENYQDFTPILAQEKLEEIHKIKRSYGLIRNIMIQEGLYRSKKRKTNKKYFSQRPRKDYCGELIQFDGSYHNWLEGRCQDKELKKEQCLLLAVDDATGKITHAKLDKNESVKSVFLFWKSYVETKGKPMTIYLDKFSTYKINHKNAVDNKDLKTQFERATTELGIKMIFANSPQAKGRVERMNGTLQDRLTKEMRLVNINNIADANNFIDKEFIPKFNKKFSVKARKTGNVHIKLTNRKKKNLNNIFSIKNIRIVRNDFVVQYKNRYFQLNEIQKNTTVYKKDKVIVEEHLDDNIHICKKTNNGDKYLEFTELKEKPEKEIPIKLPALTVTKTQYIPPANHPWRSFQFSKHQQIKEKVKI